MTNDNGTYRTLYNKFFIRRPNHKPAHFFARWVSNRGFLALAFPYVGALEGHI